MSMRRKHERVTFLAEADVHCPKTGNSFSASITTLGRRGLGMFTSGFLEINSLVEISITFRNSAGRPVKEQVQGRVTGANIGMDGNTLGVEFHETVDSEKNPGLFEYLNQSHNRNLQR